MPSTWLRVALVGSLVALALAVSLQPIASLDYWWHLRSGQQIFETSSVPSVDPFSFSVAGEPWVAAHWLYQLCLYGVYAAGGHTANALAMPLCVLLLLALVLPPDLRRRRPALTALVLAWMLLLVSPRILPRPELPTFLVLALLLRLFDRFEERGDAWIYLVVPLQILWLNLHGLHAVGIAVCGIHLVAELLRSWVQRAPRWPRLRRLSAVTLLAVLVAPLHPQGLDGALRPLRHIGEIGLHASEAWVGELARLFGAGMAPLALWLLLGFAGLCLLVLVLNRRDLRLSDPLIWGAFLYLVFSAHRNQALFAIACTPILLRNGNAWLDARGAGAAHPARPVWLAVACVALLALSLGFRTGPVARWLGHGPLRGWPIAADFHPEAAVDFVAARRPVGPIFHHHADGGYLLWRLYPDYRILLDGRLYPFGRETFRRLAAEDPEGFRALDAEFHFGVALLDTRHGAYDDLVAWMQRAPGWRLTFVDDLSVLFLRADAAGAGPRALDVDDPQLFPALPQEADRARWSAEARSRFFRAVARPARGEAVWRAFRAAHPGAAGAAAAPVPRAALLHPGTPAADAAAAVPVALQRELESLAAVGSAWAVCGWAAVIQRRRSALAPAGADVG